MSIWMRIASLFGIVVLHVTFMPLLFSSVFNPITLIVVAVVWTALLGFPAVLFLLVSVIIICDSILFGSMQFTSLYFVLVSYSVSFFMKRTLLGERSVFGFFILAFFAGGATIGYPLFEELVTGASIRSFSFVSAGLHFFLALLLFFILVPILRWVESIIRTLRQEAQFSIK